MGASGERGVWAQDRAVLGLAVLALARADGYGDGVVIKPLSRPTLTGDGARAAIEGISCMGSAQLFHRPLRTHRANASGTVSWPVSTCCSYAQVV